LFHELRAPKPAHLVQKRQAVVIEGRVRPSGVGLDDGGGKRRMIANDGNDVGVPGDDPELVARIPVNGVRLAKPPEERVRVPDRVGGEQVIEIGVQECVCHSERGEACPEERKRRRESPSCR
jgi:hypothetical protein